MEAAIANPPAEPVVPKGDVGSRSGTPLVKKLGIRDDDSLTLIDAPEGFERTLGALPSGARIVDEGAGASKLLLFVSESAEFERRLRSVAAEAGEGTLWVAWPKASSPLSTDLREDAIRDAALSIGLVDTKVCAIDDDWSGLRLTRRRS